MLLNFKETVLYKSAAVDEIEEGGSTLNFLRALFESDLHSLDLMKIPILLGLIIVGLFVLFLKGIGRVGKRKK